MENPSSAWRDSEKDAGVMARIFFGEGDRETAEWFSNWGNSSKKDLSSMIHPSFMGGMITAIPLKAKYDDESWLGMWGDKSGGSVGTIFMYASFIFPILLLHHEFPFKGFDAYMGSGSVKYDEFNELHKHVKIGRGILASLVLSLTPEDETNMLHVFPDIDMSIWEHDTPEVEKE